jgi:rhodanese-related sulfurtransferase
VAEFFSLCFFAQTPNFLQFLLFLRVPLKLFGPLWHIRGESRISFPLETRMKKLMLSAVLAVSALVPSMVLACGGDSTQASAEPAKLDVKQLASLTKEKKAVPVDANGKSTRDSEGIIPGAIMLTSSSQYDVKELPKDKASKLVFYCANDKCGASHGAAKRAMENGYTNVSVLPEGIKGWKAAGQATAKPNS